MSTPPVAAQLPARARRPAVVPARTALRPTAAGAPDDHRDHPGTYARADLGPDPASAAVARRVTRDTLKRWHLEALTDDAETIASELAANAAGAAVEPQPDLPAIIFAIHRRPSELRIIAATRTRRSRTRAERLPNRSAGHSNTSSFGRGPIRPNEGNAAAASARITAAPR